MQAKPYKYPPSPQTENPPVLKLFIPVYSYRLLSQLKFRSFTFKPSALHIPTHLTCPQEIQASYMQAGLFQQNNEARKALLMSTSACIRNTVGYRLSSVATPKCFILKKAHKGESVTWSLVAKLSISFGKAPYAIP